MMQPQGCSNFSKAATNRKSVAPSIFSVSPGKSPEWPTAHPLRLASDFHAIGTKWQKEILAGLVESKRTLPTHQVRHKSHPIRIRDPKTLLDKVLAFVHTSTSTLNPERRNDFFNGLDLITRDLFHQL